MTYFEGIRSRNPTDAFHALQYSNPQTNYTLVEIIGLIPVAPHLNEVPAQSDRNASFYYPKKCKPSRGMSVIREGVIRALLEVAASLAPPYSETITALTITSRRATKALIRCQRR